MTNITVFIAEENAKLKKFTALLKWELMMSRQCQNDDISVQGRKDLDQSKIVEGPIQVSAQFHSHDFMSYYAALSLGKRA